MHIRTVARLFFFYFNIFIVWWPFYKSNTAQPLVPYCLCLEILSDFFLTKIYHMNSHLAMQTTSLFGVRVIFCKFLSITPIHFHCKRAALTFWKKDLLLEWCEGDLIWENLEFQVNYAFKKHNLGIPVVWQIILTKKEKKIQGLPVQLQRIDWHKIKIIAQK